MSALWPSALNPSSKEIYEYSCPSRTTGQTRNMPYYHLPQARIGLATVLPWHSTGQDSSSYIVIPQPLVEIQVANLSWNRSASHSSGSIALVNRSSFKWDLSLLPLFYIMVPLPSVIGTTKIAPPGFSTQLTSGTPEVVVEDVRLRRVLSE